MAESSAVQQPITDLDETAVIARDLIRFDTTNYGEGRAKGEREAAEYVEAKLAAMGLAPQLFEPEPRRTSVIARVPGRNPDKPALVLHGHLDVVPADARNWSVDPFAGEVRDGMLWGRGAVDMKDMDAMILTAARRHPRRRARCPSASSWSRSSPTRRPAAESARAGSSTTIPSCSTAPPRRSARSAGTRSPSAASAPTCCRRGRSRSSGCGSSPTASPRTARGSSATTPSRKLAEAIARLGRTEWPLHLTETTRELLAAIADTLGVDPEQVAPDELALATGSASGFITATLRTTTNPTKLDAGYKHNVIPDRAEALVDIRTLPGQEDAVLAEVRAHHRRRHRDRVRASRRRPRGAHSRAARRRRHARARAHDPGARVFPYLLSGGTDNKSLSRLGIAGYGFSPLRLPADLDFPAMFHGVDERVRSTHYPSEARS